MQIGNCVRTSTCVMLTHPTWAVRVGSKCKQHFCDKSNKRVPATTSVPVSPTNACHLKLATPVDTTTGATATTTTTTTSYIGVQLQMFALATVEDASHTHTHVESQHICKCSCQSRSSAVVVLPLLVYIGNSGLHVNHCVDFHSHQLLLLLMFWLQIHRFIATQWRRPFHFLYPHVFAPHKCSRARVCVCVCV